MAGTPGGTPERPAIFFSDATEFRAWLEEHHASASELWMGLTKAHVSPRGLTWEEAVPEALCFGWIDSVSQRIDDDARRQRWTPRKKGSTWSAVNVAHVERLIAEGRMAPAGLAAFEARRDDRTAIYSYEQAASGELPAADAAQLAAVPAAQRFWDATTPSYRRACISWVTSAKRAATNEARMNQLVECCEAGDLIPPQRYGDAPSWLARARAAAEDPGPV